MHKRPHKDTLAAFGLTPQITLWVTTFQEESVVLLQESMHFHDSWWIWYLRVALTHTKKRPPWGDSSTAFLEVFNQTRHRAEVFGFPSGASSRCTASSTRKHRARPLGSDRSASSAWPAHAGSLRESGGALFGCCSREPQETATYLFLGVV